ncbi:uncharacterized protein LOC112601632 [Melanaphis sacchari]|uniref:uncharacterized protein LOC112601632 n=1 Tax=Melanaphis sacchari TaxID=742174 RepID=UPI000DC154A8|nr:uncharacterized protein LOC112601632 [Melanaphis sacchari]
MNLREENNYVFDIRLTKLMGLYQILDPQTKRFLGRNVYHIAIAFIVMYVFTNTIVVSYSFLHYSYYLIDNMSTSMENLWLAENTFFILYKIWIIIHHSSKIWNCLSITRYGFTSFGFGRRHILDHWRERSIMFTALFTIMYYICPFIMIFISHLFNKSITPIHNRDGSVSYYRQNILNYYILVSDETYNANYHVFYFLEASALLCIATLFIMFDVLLITLYFGICVQMNIIGSAFESVGHKSISGPHSPIDFYDVI